MPEKLTKEKVEDMIRDEEKGYEEYRKYGLNNLANDEFRHKKYLESILQRFK